MGFFEGRRYFLIMGCELLIKKQIKSYKDLGVYTTAFSLAIKVHKFLVYSHASLIECLSQLQMIEELYEIKEVKPLVLAYENLGGKLYNFIRYVEKDWKTTKN